MASDHIRTGVHLNHPYGTDAECPGCRETCYCHRLTERSMRPCVACVLVILKQRP